MASRILDLDLDAFVTPINTVHSVGRLDDSCYEVTPVEQVRRFLEKSCGLSQRLPTPGRVFEEHDELFDAIKELIAAERVHSPFELVHVDAHADMGAGQWEPYEYLLTDLMYHDTPGRLNPNRGCSGLNRGTVLLFLAACEWLSKLHYVHHPDDGQDFSELFLDYDLRTQQLLFQVPRCKEQVFRQWNPFFSGPISNLRERCELGPRIPFLITSREEFYGPGFDFVFLTHSPGFTPPKADAVFAEMKKYIESVA